METYKATPRIDYQTLTNVFDVILENCDVIAVVNTYKKKNKIIAVEGEWNSFVRAYQSCVLATPLCYEVEVLDGKKFSILYHGEVVIEVSANANVVNN